MMRLVCEAGGGRERIGTVLEELRRPSNSRSGDPEMEEAEERDGRERAEVVVVVLVFGGGQVRGRAATYRKCFFCTWFTLS